VQPAANSNARRLIVNADDFGQTAGVNEGIIRCHERGIVTSASLMVRWPYARAAAEYASAHPDFSIGLHIDLGEWAYRNGEWVLLYSFARTDDRAAVRTEVLNQLETFRRLMGSDPTHLDSHQHVHRSRPIDAIVAEVSATLAVPVRHATGAVRYVGSFYGQDSKGEPLDHAITVDALISTLQALPAGTTELGCHPAVGHDVAGMYIIEREQEMKVLCDPEVRAALEVEDIRLISFREL